MAQYEIEICSLQEKNPILSKNKKEKRFVPKFCFTNYKKWPNLHNFTDSQIKYYEERLNETDNIFLKIRYSDFLFEYGDKNTTKNKYEISRILLSSLVEISSHIKDENNYISTIARIVEVSLLMSNQEKLQKAIDLIYIQLSENEEHKEYKWLYELSKLIREILNSKFKSMILESNINKIIDALEKAIKNYFEGKNYHLHRIFCEELIQYSKLNLITLAKKEELQLSIGKSLELEASYQQGRKNKSLMIKADLLECVQDFYVKIGKKEKIDEMKKLIKKTYKDLEKSDEMCEMTAPIKISENSINKFVEYFVSSDIPKSLDKIAYRDDFIPKIKEVEELVDKLRKDYPLQYLIPKSLLSDGKNRSNYYGRKQENNQF